jgi:hypothetical protein
LQYLCGGILVVLLHAGFGIPSGLSLVQDESGKKNTIEALAYQLVHPGAEASLVTF